MKYILVAMLMAAVMWSAHAGAAEKKRVSPEAPAGLAPMTEPGFYERDGKRYERGLYPGGKNEMPSAHRAAGEKLAATIQPDRQERIVAVVAGHSNPKAYFGGFIKLVQAKAAAGEVNGKLVMNNQCSGGKMCQDWAAEARAGKLTLPQDAQVMILLTSYHNATEGRTRSKNPEVFEMSFEQRTAAMKKDLKDILQAAAVRCPNLKMAYLGCDTWRGNSGLEPQVYEEAWAFKSLIEDQIKGDPELAYSGPNRKAPWLAWGGYIWEPNAPAARFVKDGVHPSEAGVNFVIGRWYEALSADSTARGWFRVK